MVVILAGFGAGILSGMGVGGGMILIPALSVFAGVEQHVAQSVNLFYFIPTAAAALAVHIKNKNVEIRTAVKLSAAGIAFALLGSYLAVRLPAEILRKIFAVFVAFSGVREIISGIKAPGKAKKKVTGN